MLSRTSAECPWCQLPLVIPRGGWAYRRSQVVQHLVSCSAKPAGLPPAELNTTADVLIEHVLDELA